MASSWKIQQAQNRRNLPRSAKNDIKQSTVEGKDDARNMDESDKPSLNDPEESPILEFVTFTGPAQSNDGISKKIRTQVMRDYIRKQNRQAITGESQIVKSTNPEKPSKYKGKFKLDTWSHKTKTKAQDARRSREKKSEDERNSVQPQWDPLEDSRGGDQVWRNRQPSPVFFLDTRRLDPFGSFSVNLGPRSERLLLHYHNSYSMNSVAINPTGDFFSQAKTDPAVLHSILYLVALHHDLKLGITDSPESLYHGSEAFKIINERLEEGFFSDRTIAAVAMLVTKENLNGKYELSKIHMDGLQYMVMARGGIHMVKGVFQRVATWSDFCFANVWSCQPRFPRVDFPLTKRIETLESDLDLLAANNLFGPDSPIITIFESLRKLSHDLDQQHITSTDRIRASSMIYETEYSLLALNRENVDDLDSTSCIYSFEAIPLKTAAHLFLYLAIREIPHTSQLLFRLVERLQESIEIQLGGWWNANDERRTWLLWMLFIGGSATVGKIERWWFVKKMGNICAELGITSEQKFKEALKRVLWKEVWCAVHRMSLWNDLMMLREEEELLEF